MLTRRSILAAGLLAPVAARAQPASSGIIRIINPFPAGGASDSIARLLQPGLQARDGVGCAARGKRIDDPDDSRWRWLGPRGNRG